MQDRLSQNDVTNRVNVERADDVRAAAWRAALPAEATPRDMAPLPIFGYPGWFRGSNSAAFYDDQRYFRPFRRDLPAVK